MLLIEKKRKERVSILIDVPFERNEKGSTRIPVKHAQWMAFLQQFVNISFMQCPSNNKDNVINHVPIPVENIIPL
jgi:hypothetical protein